MKMLKEVIMILNNFPVVGRAMSLAPPRTASIFSVGIGILKNFPTKKYLQERAV